MFLYADARSYRCSCSVVVSCWRHDDYLKLSFCRKKSGGNVDPLAESTFGSLLGHAGVCIALFHEYVCELLCFAVAVLHRIGSSGMLVLRAQASSLFLGLLSDDYQNFRSAE